MDNFSALRQIKFFYLLQAIAATPMVRSATQARTENIGAVLFFGSSSAYGLDFDSGLSGMNNTSRANGYSVRCEKKEL